MPILPLTHIRNVDHAREGARLIAEHIRDALNPPLYVGPYPAPGESCTNCGLTAEVRLYKIVVNVVSDEYVLLGIPRCCRDHLSEALTNFLTEENAGTNGHRAARIRRLEDALAAIDR